MSNNIITQDQENGCHYDNMATVHSIVQLSKCSSAGKRESLEEENITDYQDVLR